MSDKKSVRLWTSRRLKKEIAILNEEEIKYVAKKLSKIKNNNISCEEILKQTVFCSEEFENKKLYQKIEKILLSIKVIKMFELESYLLLKLVEGENTIEELYELLINRRLTYEALSILEMKIIEREEEIANLIYRETDRLKLNKLISICMMYQEHDKMLFLSLQTNINKFLTAYFTILALIIAVSQGYILLFVSLFGFFIWKISKGRIIKKRTGYLFIKLTAEDRKKELENLPK